MQMPNDEYVKTTIMVEFSKTIEQFGLSSVEAQLFAYLYLSDTALTLDEMSEAIGKSKTSMSTSIRSLADLNLVSRVWRKGVRKDLYQANNQLFKTFINSYSNKWIDATNHQKDTLESIKFNLEPKEKEETSDNSPTIDERLDDILEFHTLIENAFKEMKHE